MSYPHTSLSIPAPTVKMPPSFPATWKDRPGACTKGQSSLEMPSPICHLGQVIYFRFQQVLTRCEHRMKNLCPAFHGWRPGWESSV